jgi:hypothetical protein
LTRKAQYEIHNVFPKTRDAAKTLSGEYTQSTLAELARLRDTLLRRLPPLPVRASEVSESRDLNASDPYLNDG